MSEQPENPQNTETPEWPGAGEWRRRVDALLPQARADLARLVAIPSISALDPAAVADSAAAVHELLAGLGLETRTVTGTRPDGEPGLPAVIATRPAPPGRPTVLLYAHHDVQPAGDLSLWRTDPWQATEVDGRLYGRGTADDKAGVMVHVLALRALLAQWGPGDGVGLVVFVEGEEESGSVSFTDLLATHRDTLAADVIVVADSDNWTPQDPSLTVSLRGMMMADVEVATLTQGLHSGIFGGAAPDAVMALTTLLARLWDEDGALAVPGLEGARRTTLTVDDDEYVRQAGLLDGVGLIGSGAVLDRVWNQASLTVTGIDVPSVAQAANVLLPSARARLVLRVPPDRDPRECSAALERFLTTDPPFGAQVTYTLTETGRGFAAPLDGPVYDAARAALSEAFAREVVEQGIGGSIPFIADLADAFPRATVVITGVEDPQTFAHAANESLGLDLFGNAALAEALFLESLATMP